MEERGHADEKATWFIKLSDLHRHGLLEYITNLDQFDGMESPQNKTYPLSIHSLHSTQATHSLSQARGVGNAWLAGFENLDRLLEDLGLRPASDIGIDP